MFVLILQHFRAGLLFMKSGCAIGMGLPRVNLTPRFARLFLKPLSDF